ncbi:unnamed protein product, partial [Scytosiphon promiscuus]
GFRTYSEIDSDDDPEGILSDNSGVDSDDGSSTSSKGTQEGACGDRPSTPQQPPFSSARPSKQASFPTTGTVRRGRGGASTSPNGIRPEPGTTPSLSSLEIEPAESIGMTMASKGDGGSPKQEWRTGISPLTSPAVAGGPGVG